MCWDVRRTIGMDECDLAACCEWGYEQGVHRRPELPAKWALLFREWLALKEWPQTMMLEIERAKREAARLAKGGR